MHHFRNMAMVYIYGISEQRCFAALLLLMPLQIGSTPVYS